MHPSESYRGGMMNLPSSVSPRNGTTMVAMNSNPNLMMMNTNNTNMSAMESDSKPIDLEMFKGDFLS